jgi:GrpB-like predicted nucleotidyltransferase (UPF0157 family)
VDAPPIRPYPFPAPAPALREWNPRAPAAAARVIALIQERLPETTVEHVGSSSVPGCAGKGYLDLAMAYRDEEHLSAINEVLFALGFGRQRGREPFPESRPMRHGIYDHAGESFLLHIHVVPASGEEIDEFRDFRDRLRSDPVLVEAYVATKCAIIAGGVRDGTDYAKAKGTFIENLGYRGAENA